LKYESGESDIIVYDMHDDYSLGRSSKSKKETDREEKKETPVSNQNHDNSESLALKGGFSGRVYDKLTYRTIEGALVTIAKDLSIKTDEKGNFVATGIKPGKYRITVFEEGYMAQSCKSTAIAGETTKLDSFHLIPDCLVAEYPDDIMQEEETAEEEFVEFAMEAPQLILSEVITQAPETESIRKEETEADVAPDKLPEQTMQASSGNTVAEDTHAATTPDLKIRKGIAGEKAVEHHKKQGITADSTPVGDVRDEVLHTFEEITETAADVYVDIVTAVVEEMKEIPPDEIIALLLEQIETTTTENAAEAALSALKERMPFLEEPFIPEISLVPIEAAITEVGQPKETPERVQEETPREITIEEAPVEIAAKVMIQEEAERAGPQEQSAELSAGEAVQKVFLPLKQQEPSSEVISQSAEEEVVQTKETSQAPSGEKSRLGKLWQAVRNKIAKELELSPEESAGLSAGEVVEETAPLPEQQEQPLSPPEKTASEIEAQEVVSEKPVEDTQPITTPLEEMQFSTTFQESTETVIFVPEGVVAEGVSSIGELPRMSVETGAAEATQSEETAQELSGEEVIVRETSVGEISVGTMVEETVQEKTKKEISQEELPESPIATAPEITAREEIVAETSEEGLLEPSVEGLPELAAQKEVLEEVRHEELSVDVSLKGIATLAMFADSTEAIMPAPEKTIVGDILFVGQFPHIFVEADITEMTLPQEVLLEIPGRESPIDSTTGEMVQEEIKEDVCHEQPLDPSVEIAPEIVAWPEIIEDTHKEESLEPPIDFVLDSTAHEEITEVIQPEVVPHEIPREVSREVSEETSGSKLVWWTRRKKKTKQADQEQLSGPSMRVSSEIAPQKKTVREAERKGPSVDASEDKRTASVATKTIQTPPVIPDLAEAIISAPQQIVVESASSVEELPRMSIKAGGAEATQSEEVPRTPDTCGVAADVTTAEDSVADKEVTEDISDDDLASMSDEEKKAMSRGHDSAEVEGFIGIINAQPNPAYKGLPVSIAYTLRNVACDKPDDFILQVIVTDPDTSAILETFETQVACSKNTFSMGGFVIFTTAYETRTYSLNMKIVSKKAKISHLLIDIPLEIKAIY
jgi:hypothetical protein